MSFVPKFMKSFKTFDRERRSLRTAKQWHAFRKRWFDSENWPEKSKDRLGRHWDKQQKLISKIRDGRRWAPGLWIVDLAPEARYHYFWTLWVIGSPLLDSRWNEIRRTPETRWWQECGYCQISTQDFGDLTCPVCRREMYWTWVGD